ncbi:hypothetical protein [Vibrio sp. 10N.261.55.A7]|uniref:hypothetical protein n=1 Tax=Vibrio sp. 10N.261.55.A7 TaxID=1880851 RepID=UPI0018E4A0FE|nr:hypothetical protein [Vibrio sp. 10N.261.55.A7]
MDIEIYMPCNPDWFCNGLLWVFLLLGVVGALLFVKIVINEYRKIQSRDKQNKNKRK